MTYSMHWASALACGVALLVQAGGATACSCPKEQLIKKYGTVSQLQHPSVPLPPPLPPAKGGAPANG